MRWSRTRVWWTFTEFMAKISGTWQLSLNVIRMSWAMHYIYGTFLMILLAKPCARWSAPYSNECVHVREKVFSWKFPLYPSLADSKEKCKIKTKMPQFFAISFSFIFHMLSIYMSLYYCLCIYTPCAHTSKHKCASHRWKQDCFHHNEHFNHVCYSVSKWSNKVRDIYDLPPYCICLVLVSSSLVSN